jgi:uncharacterized membrane protein YjfL (UPF0719 family)
VLQLPPRDAGWLLDAALAAAMATGEAAVHVAAPILRSLTADPSMVSIVAYGMAEEVMICLRKRGAA